MAPRTPIGARFTPRTVAETEVTERVECGIGAATWRYRARVCVAATATDVRSRAAHRDHRPTDRITV
ncbi:hypothetical protein ACWEO2_01330 [Nocardia sp. NPDC004278]